MMKILMAGHFDLSPEELNGLEYSIYCFTMKRKCVKYKQNQSNISVGPNKLFECFA